MEERRQGDRERERDRRRDDARDRRHDCRRWQGALRLLREMRGRGVPADAVTLGAAIGACERGHRETPT